MIEIGQHPADEVPLFGHTAHGLVKGVVGELRCVVDGVEYPLPSDYDLPAAETLQIVQHPAAGPVALSPEVLAAERAEGRVWQNYALVKYGSIYGQPLSGYIHIDSLGRRWAVVINSLQDATPGAPYSLTLDCRPFGYLDGAPEDMAPVELTVTCADIQQITSGARWVYRGMADSTGSRIILMLVPKNPSDALPSGFLQISISDTGGVPAATLSVLRSQEAVRGEWSNTHEDVASPFDLLSGGNRMRFGGVLSGAVYPDIPEAPWFPEGGGTVTLSVDTLYRLSGGGAETYWTGSVEASCGRTGRVLALAFDDADELIEFTVDTAIEYSATLPDYTGSVSGTLTAHSSFHGPVTSGGVSWSGSVAGSVSRTVTESVEKRITLRRQGVAVYAIVDAASYSATLTSELPLTSARLGAIISADDQTWYANAGTPTGAFPMIFSEVAAVSYQHGGEWPANWTGPVDVYGSGSPLPLSAQFPWGHDDESGADTFGTSFTPYAYRTWQGLESATLAERNGTSPGAHWDGVRAYAHATVTLEDMYLSSGVGRRIAYHPVEHTIYIDVENKIASYV